MAVGFVHQLKLSTFGKPDPCTAHCVFVFNIPLSLALPQGARELTFFEELSGLLNRVQEKIHVIIDGFFPGIGINETAGEIG